MRWQMLNSKTSPCSNFELVKGHQWILTVYFRLIIISITISTGCPKKFQYLFKGVFCIKVECQTFLTSKRNPILSEEFQWPIDSFSLPFQGSIVLEIFNRWQFSWNTKALPQKNCPFKVELIKKLMNLYYIIIVWCNNLGDK